MDSPFQRASSIEPKLKAFIWGGSGVGKTILALQFPKPVMIDMESGSSLYGKSFKFDVLSTTDPDQVIEAVRGLKHDKHPYKTLILDPITIFWEALQKKWSDIYLKRLTGTKAHKHEYYDMQPGDWGTIKGEYKELIQDLLAIDMNVIVIAREKTNYKDGEFMKVAGVTFDAEKHTDYAFDTVLRLFVEGGKYFMMKQKDRSNRLPDDPIPTSYKKLEELFGKEVLDRKVEPVVYAKKAQKDQITKLCAELKIPSTTLNDRLKNCGATCLNDLSEKNATEFIAKLLAVKAAAKKATDKKVEPKKKGETNATGKSG